MKRWIHADTELTSSFKPGGKVTVYESTVGHANYDAEFVRYETNQYGLPLAVVKTRTKQQKVPVKMVIPSEKEYFYSLTREDVLTQDFVAKLIHKEDSMFCHKIHQKRVDKDPEMENVTGVDAYIANDAPGKQSYRVAISTYITKKYTETREDTDERGVGIDDQLIDDALGILSQAPEFYVNFAGYQRAFKA